MRNTRWVHSDSSKLPQRLIDKELIEWDGHVKCSGLWHLFLGTHAPFMWSVLFGWQVGSSPSVCVDRNLETGDGCRTLLQDQVRNTCWFGNSATHCLLSAESSLTTLPLLEGHFPSAVLLIDDPFIPAAYSVHPNLLQNLRLSVALEYTGKFKDS